MPGTPDPKTKYDALIYDTAVNNGLPPNMAKLLVAQAKLESGYKGLPYNSPVFKANNNFFGYKFIGQPLATKGSKAPSNEGDNYAKYETLENSVLELVGYIKRRQNRGQFPADLTNINPTEYARLLKSVGYYGGRETDYARNLVNWFKTIDITPVKAGIGLGVIALIIGALYLFRK